MSERLSSDETPPGASRRAASRRPPLAERRDLASAARLSDAAVMHVTRWIALGSVTLLFACPKDDNSDDGNTSMTTTMQPTTSGVEESSSTAPAETSTGVAETSTGVAETSTGVAESSSDGACAAGSECMEDMDCPGGGMCLGCVCVGGNQCDPIIQGEWNACVNENGMTDNTLCNWVGMGGAQGFIGCLNSSQMDGSNVCFISDCVDACDCFAPPATGTAEVVCAAILADGGNGCALDCSAGKVCPDGMECQNDICFWPGMG